MKPSGHALALVFALGAAVIAPVSASADQAGVSIGTLECQIEGGIGLIITSSKNMKCIFRSASGREEIYVGRIVKYGLDIGITGEASMIWAVFAPGFIEPGALGGEYVGGSAEVSAGLGGGANALIGGGNIALQPLSVQVHSGVNAAFGVTRLSLQHVD